MLNTKSDPHAQKIYEMYKSLSTNPVDYIGNIEIQIDTLLRYSQSIKNNK